MTANVPNMAGKVLTVQGPKDPDVLGPTLMHEHLFIIFYRGVLPDHYTPATDWCLWEQELTMDKLDMVRARKPLRDNWLLIDERATIEEAMEFRYRGGGTIVDVTSIGIGRDPLALSRVSQATGLNVVMGAGWYQKLYHPVDMDDKTVEDMTDEIVRDITVGIGDTGIRSGIIGEVGIEGDPITENEVKSIRASGRASRATGAPISFHRGGVGREKLAVIGMLGEEGTDMSRVIFGHSDPIAGDLDLMLELLGHGVYIQFDLLGRLGAPLRARAGRRRLRNVLHQRRNGCGGRGDTAAHRGRIRRPHPAVPGRVRQGTAQAIRRNRLLLHHGKIPARTALPGASPKSTSR